SAYVASASWRTMTGPEQHAQARVAAPWRKRLEPGEPFHRLDRCRSLRPRTRGGARSGTASQGRRVCVRYRLYLRPEARDPHAVVLARRARSDVDSGREELAAQRAALWRAPGTEQGGNQAEARRGSGQ